MGLSMFIGKAALDVALKEIDKRGGIEVVSQQICETAKDGVRKLKNEIDERGGIGQIANNITGTFKDKTDKCLFCKNCGKKLETGARFCDECGTANNLNF